MRTPICLISNVGGIRGRSNCETNGHNEKVKRIGLISLTRRKRQRRATAAFRYLPKAKPSRPNLAVKVWHQIEPARRKAALLLGALDRRLFSTNTYNSHTANNLVTRAIIYIRDHKELKLELINLDAVTHRRTSY